MSQVAIIMGSRSDLDYMKETFRVLDHFGISFSGRALSAHRTPEALANFLDEAEKEGAQIIICGAGGAAHLAGVAASHTLLPVIGVPMPSKINGLDSLYATVQMPRGVPVATTAIGGSGAYNAALLAVQILALSDPNLKENFRQFRKQQSQKVLDCAVIEKSDWQ